MVETVVGLILGPELWGPELLVVLRPVTGGREVRRGVSRPLRLGARGCHVVGGGRRCGLHIRGSLVSCHPQAGDLDVRWLR